MKKLFSFACIAALTLPLIAADQKKDAKKKESNMLE